MWHKRYMKQLIEVFNLLGICMSYDEVGQNYSKLLVPVPQSIIPNVLVQGAMGNFHHEENTQSGIGGTHDTVMVLFQNNEKRNVKNYCKEVLVAWKSSYMFFALNRYVTKSYFDEFGVNEASNIPSRSATNSARIVNDAKKTSVGFTPLLPYPDTTRSIRA